MRLGLYNCVEGDKGKFGLRFSHIPFILEGGLVVVFQNSDGWSVQNAVMVMVMEVENGE